MTSTLAINAGAVDLISGSIDVGERRHHDARVPRRIEPVQDPDQMAPGSAASPNASVSVNVPAGVVPVSCTRRSAHAHPPYPIRAAIGGTTSRHPGSSR
jgi:hypothetical protein